MQPPLQATPHTLPCVQTALCKRCKEQGRHLVVSLPPAGGAGALSGFQALQESCERVVVRTMATQVVTLLGAARLQPWLPTEPPRTALGHSSYVQELIKYLQVRGLSQNWLEMGLAGN